MLTGQNGILNRAQEAKENTEISQEDENEKMQEYEDIISQFVPETAGTVVKTPDSYNEGTPSNAQAISDGTGKIFALPEGATYVKGTVDTGVVVTIKGSEFVWVPVDDVVLDTKRDTELPKTSSEAGIKTYTPMAVQDGSNYKGLLYDFSGNNGYLKYGSNTNNYQGSTSEYREPDIVSEYDGGEYDTVEGSLTLTNLTKEYNAMIESVKKYKGFYVAQYEASIDTSKTEKPIVFRDASKDSNITTVDASMTETNSWYGLYKKIKTFSTDTDKVVSSMIWGSQYDAMMNWMAKTGNTVGTEDDTKKNTERVTGKNTHDVINNIYDLYGCHVEWTLEAYNISSRVQRGGYFEYSESPAIRGYNNPQTMYSGYSSHATLYIK